MSESVDLNEAVSCRRGCVEPGWKAAVALPATCGELAQGTLDGVPCLISCPIDRYGIAEVEVRTCSGWDLPSDAQKAVAALRAGLKRLRRGSHGGRLHLISDLPRGRGYASSTVDVGATLYALGEALGAPLPPAEVARLAIGVEPSDGTIFPGLVLFDHRGGSFCEELGTAPVLGVVGIDPGGAVDTLHFNRRDNRETLRALAPRHREAFALVIDGLSRGDGHSLGAGATISATAHQAILFNGLLERAFAVGREVGALGVCRAHSGTLLGLLLDPLCADMPEIVRFVQRRFDGLAEVRAYTLVGGGPRPAAVEEFRQRRLGMPEAEPR